MKLSNSLIKQFTEATRDKPDASAKNEAYGTVANDGSVVLDGAPSPTPCSNTVSANPGDRVIVKIVNHQAVVTGNLTSKSLDTIATDKRIDLKMSGVIETVDEYGIRIDQVESDIQQTQDEILLKVDNTKFDEEMQKVGEKTASLDVSVGLIEGKVAETEWYTVGEDNLQDSSGSAILDSSGGNTVGITKITKESAIRQNADEIKLRVTNTTFNALDQRVSTAESTIVQHSNAIALKVNQSDFNSLGQRVSTAESTITLHTNQISTKVSAGEIASSINQTAQTVKIAASKIDIDGVFTVNDYFKVIQDDEDFYDWIEVNGRMVFDDEGYFVDPNVLGNVYVNIPTPGSWDSDYGDYKGITIREWEGEETATLHIYADSNGNIIVAEEADEGVGVRIGTNNHPISYIRALHLLANGFEVPQILYGETSITPTAANTPTKKSITFSKEFSGVPKVMATYVGTAPGTVVTGVSVSNIKKTGFDLYVTRTSTTATSICWVAFY